MLQEKTPLQRKTRSESAGEGRKAGRGAAAGHLNSHDRKLAVSVILAERRELLNEIEAPSKLLIRIPFSILPLKSSFGVVV